MPKPLRDSSDSSYIPFLVSIGPFHYGKEELQEMEKFKSEAVRRMEKRIQRKDPRASIKSIVEKHIQPKDKDIREFYSEDISQFNSIELAWMVTRDACFIFELLVNYLEKGLRDQQFYAKEVTKFSWIYDPVFDAAFQNPRIGKLMDDIFLFENQIPLWVLQVLLEMEMGGIDDANLKLDNLIKLMLKGAIRHSIFMWWLKKTFSECCKHLLEALYVGMVGPTDVDLSHGVEPPKASSRNCMQNCFEKGVESVKATCRRWCKLDLCALSSNTNPDEANRILLVKLPTAVELTRRGVKIYPVTEECDKEGYPALSFIRFDEKTSTLYLPEMTVTPESISVMRNCIAMELVILEKMYCPRPLTQFALFMNELIDSEEDVALLRKAEVIHNFLDNNREVAHHLNSLTKGIAPYSSCKVIDDVRKGLLKYTRRKYKILWSEFVRAYFSKPWHVASSMAAVLLLLMTMTQVFCLFFTRKSQ